MSFWRYPLFHATQDERPFEAVQMISEFNQRAYELFLRPFVKAAANEWTARLLRHFPP